MNSLHNFSCLLLILANLLATTLTKNANQRQIDTIMKHMNTTADPCEDFYQYACGNWGQIHEGHAGYYETIGYVDHKVNHEFARFINKLKNRRNLKAMPKFLHKVLSYYKSCKNMIVYEPTEYLNWLHKHENLTWPLGKQRKSKMSYDWLHLLATLRKYGFNGIFIELTTIQQRDDARITNLDVDKPVMNGGFQPLSAQMFKVVLEDLRVMHQVDLTILWQEIHAFELKLQALDKIADIMGNQLKSVSYFKLPWLERYLKIFLSNTYNSHMKISMQNLPYFKSLLALLDEHKPEFVYRYIMLRFLWYMNVEGPHFFSRHDCIDHMRSMLPLAMHWLYEHSKPHLLAQQAHIEKLFHELLLHFEAALNANANLFTGHVLKFLRSKVQHMQLKLGNLPRPNATAKVELFYASLNLSTHNFYAAHLQILEHASRARIQRLQVLLPRNEALFHLEDSETGSSSSPYYLLRSNVVIVPLTALQTPIFHESLDDIFKYSLLGFLLAHEITHGFDDSGIEFDQSGNMRGPANIIKANKLFDTNLNCLRSLNPQVIDEKIADVSGVRWAYEAYFKNHSNTELPAELRYLETAYTAPQLFFLNSAQFFCGISNEMLLVHNDHGSDHQRVIDMLSNFAEFGRAFECDRKSAMHPQRKCQLWR